MRRLLAILMLAGFAGGAEAGTALESLLGETGAAAPAVPPVPGERGRIETASGLRINCSRPAYYTNAEYRRLREFLDASPIKLGHLLYATSTERPEIGELAEFRRAAALNPAELYAILAYTGGAYENINRPLWTDDAAGISAMRLPVSVICSGLSKLPNYSGEVRRGTFYAGDLERLREGDIYVNKAFMSTSIGQVDLYSRLPVQLRILSKNGKRIDHLSSYDEHSVTPEKEVLFIPRSRFMIKSKKVSEKNYKRYYEIELEELDAPAEVFGSAPAPAQPLLVGGEVSAADGLWSSSDAESRKRAEETCRERKAAADILGECHVRCVTAGKVAQCSWAASDWMTINPFTLRDAMDAFYKVK